MTITGATKQQTVCAMGVGVGVRQWNTVTVQLDSRPCVQRDGRGWGKIGGQ